MTDAPLHYQQEITPLEYITKNRMDFASGNVVKYVTRFRDKGGSDDLVKAADYIRKLLEAEYGLTFDLEVRPVIPPQTQFNNTPPGFIRCYSLGLFPEWKEPVCGTSTKLTGYQYAN